MKIAEETINDFTTRRQIELPAHSMAVLRWESGFKTVALGRVRADAGKSRVLAITGTTDFDLEMTVRQRGHVRRLIGCEAFSGFPYADDLRARILTVGESLDPELVVDRFACWFLTK